MAHFSKILCLNMSLQIEDLPCHCNSDSFVSGHEIATVGSFTNHVAK